MNVLRKFSTSLGLAALLLTTPLMLQAGTIVGQIDDTEQGVVVIDGDRYRIEQSALVGKAPNQKRSLKLSDLSSGQIVKYSPVQDRITKLEILHGETEVPN